MAKTKALISHREADLRLCFRICKNPVFTRRGSIIRQWYERHVSSEMVTRVRVGLWLYAYAGTSLWLFKEQHLIFIESHHDKSVFVASAQVWQIPDSAIDARNFRPGIRWIVLISGVAYVLPWSLFVNQGFYIPKCSSRRVHSKNRCCQFFQNKLKVKVKGQRSKIQRDTVQV